MHFFEREDTVGSVIWILVLLCLGLGALIGFYQGPLRNVFALLGLMLGCLLAKPLSPVFRPIVSAFGAKNPAWVKVMPSVVVFIIIVAALGALGTYVHRRLTVKYKYTDENDVQYYRWDRFSRHVGICTGLFVGAAYFLILLLPIYIGGYFTLLFSDNMEQKPASVRAINTLRAEIEETKLDKLAATFDPTPEMVYQAADTVALIASNPDLQTRLGHYPVLMTLAERPEFAALASDPKFAQLFASQKSVKDLLDYPKVQALLTNQTAINSLIDSLTNNLADLNDYLKTGKSKYDSEKALGLWVPNVSATYLEERKKLTDKTATQISQMRPGVESKVYGLSLLVTTDNTILLKKTTSPNQTRIVSKGTWKKNGDKYHVNFPDAVPADVEMTVQPDGSLVLPANGVTLVLNRVPIDTPQ